MKFKTGVNRSAAISLAIVIFLISPLLRFNASAEAETTLTLSSGIRVDNLDWNIAGNIYGTNPNVLSELTWDDLLILQLKADGKLVMADRLYLRGYVDYGWIFDGENQDSDYAGDDRTREWSRSNNDTNDDNVLDASLGVGYQFGPVWKILKITPLAGYSYHEQNLVITNGHQTIPPLGPFSGLDSTYDTEWKGPWAGVDLGVLFEKKLAVTGSFEYHWVDYYAAADWNLRTDFQHPKSFEHDADGEGVLVSADLDLFLSEQVSLSAMITYQNFWTDDGTAQTFYASGRTSKTRLNEVNWESFAGMIGIAFIF